jgi:hypothetical protein
MRSWAARSETEFASSRAQLTAVIAPALAVDSRIWLKMIFDG